LTVEHQIRKRGKRLYLDTARNSYAQTAVAPYSVRAKPNAPVATPLEWKKLDDPELRSNTYTIENVFAQLDQHGDPWRGMQDSAKGLDEARQALDQYLRVAA
jgi:bifunctional non-homologous end joining protein LigD